MKADIVQVINRVWILRGDGIDEKVCRYGGLDPAG